MNQLLRTMNTDPADNNNSYLFDPCEKPEDKKEDKSQR